MQYIYLGMLSAESQLRFLEQLNEARRNGVSADEFIEAWNFYAESIEQHVFLTETPGSGAATHVP